MNRALGFLLVATFVCLGEGRWISLSANNDPLELVKEIIYEANQEVDKMGMAVINVTTQQDLFYVKDGKLGKLDTLELRGEKQFFNQTDKEEESVFTFDLHVGLRDLQFQGEVGFKYLLFHLKGILSVGVINESVRVQGSIVSRNDGTCSATIDSAVIEELGDIQINYTDNWLLTHVIQFTIDHFLPMFKGVINGLLAGIVRDQVPKSDFEKLACQPFVI